MCARVSELFAAGNWKWLGVQHLLFQHWEQNRGTKRVTDGRDMQRSLTEMCWEGASNTGTYNVVDKEDEENFFE